MHPSLDSVFFWGGLASGLFSVMAITLTLGCAAYPPKKVAVRLTTDDGQAMDLWVPRTSLEMTAEPDRAAGGRPEPMRSSSKSAKVASSA